MINLHKPMGITSAKALYRVRAITGQRKSGHAGSLDPAATGVLVLCMGKATKLVESMMECSKVYVATGRLDVTSESLDSDRPLEPVPVSSLPKLGDIEEVCRGFIGTTMQVPPKVSALKVGGVPAYRRAARNESVTLAPRPVRIDRLTVVRYDWPELQFEVCCGRGTYVRALIRDIGAKLGCGGCLTSLVRTRVGPFRIEDAWTIDGLKNANSFDSYLIPYETVLPLIHADHETNLHRGDGTPPAIS